MKRKYSPKPVGYSWIVLNDRVRKEFVLDEASFYDDWQSSGLSMQKFLRKYRDHIDTYIIDRQLHNWDRPAGYGQYPRSY